MDELRYQKPVYDPFEVFQPSKTFLREVTKNLNQQAYELILENRADDFAEICNEKRLAKLNNRIRDYTFRLRADNQGHQRSGSLGQDHINQAKQVPIQDFYTGQLRKAGKTLVGKCPLREERTGSFTIYPDTNTWHCYSCSQGRDGIDLVMKLHNLSFFAAVKFILHA